MDVRDPDDALLRLEQARGAFAQDGPLIPAGYLFSGYSAQARDRLPAGVEELVIELADAVADSGPFEIGLSAMEWVIARDLTNAAAASLRGGSRTASYGKAKQAVLVVHGMFERIVGRIPQHRPLAPTLKGIAAELAPEERLLFASETSGGSGVLATDQRVLLRALDGAVMPSAWSREYSQISSVTVRWLLWSGAYRVTLVAGDDEMRIHCQDKSSATVLAEIWRHRGTRGGSS